ncbi:hypothetical protein ACFRAU_03365 [Arthrobacter sp. NPDC056691]|uniref:hypothetical protein n=1 Tax=Arthrobacter sp. NPDC056691 TaxID=3345913 RepID=UPI00366F1BBF
MTQLSRTSLLRPGEFVDVAKELLRRPVQECSGLSVHFHPVVRSLQLHRGSTLAQGNRQAVNGAGDAKGMKVDRVYIGEGAAYGDHVVAY